jgi:hypothetical protein
MLDAACSPTTSTPLLIASPALAAASSVPVERKPSAIVLIALSLTYVRPAARAADFYISSRSPPLAPVTPPEITALPIIFA